MVQKHLAGEQETHWDKTNKELTSSKMVIFIVCLVPVRFLLTNKVFLYHVTGHMQRPNQFSARDAYLILGAHGRALISFFTPTFTITMTISIAQESRSSKALYESGNNS